VIDFIPGSGFVSDDWTEIGAAIGAFIGYRKDNKKTFENGITGIKLVCFAVEIIPGILTLLITRQHEKHVIHACCLKSKSVTGGL
uniref:hypothetical protein n=1 Tax=Desulfobacter vibrioformis TaxID=34031 RepID=UPI0005506382